MTFFYESEEDLALRGQGCLGSVRGDTFASMQNISSMDVTDFIEANFQSPDSEQEEERREDRYEQMAERHHV